MPRVQRCMELYGVHRLLRLNMVSATVRIATARCGQTYPVICADHPFGQANLATAAMRNRRD